MDLYFYFYFLKFFSVDVGNWRDGGGKSITSDPQTGDDEKTGNGSQAIDSRPHDSDDEQRDGVSVISVIKIHLCTLGKC